jgi:hypothetical protein
MVYSASISVKTHSKSKEGAVERIKSTYNVSEDNLNIIVGEPLDEVETPYITVVYNKHETNGFGGTIHIPEDEKAEWKIPFEVATNEPGVIPESDSHESDRLLETPHAPLRLKKRVSPFSITIKELVLSQEYERGSVQETASEFFEEIDVGRETTWEDYILPGVDVRIEE